MRSNRFLRLFAAALVLAPLAAFAADGQPDTTFSGDGKLISQFNLGQGFWDQGVSVSQDPAGRIVLGGWVQRSIAGDTDFGLVRVDHGGTPDSVFGTGGRRIIFFDLGDPDTEFREDKLGEVVVMADGRIVSCGSAEYATPLGSAHRLAVARLNENGTSDATFNYNSAYAGHVVLSPFDHDDSDNPTCTSMVVHEDGRVVVPFYNEVHFQTGLMRLQNDGAPDPTFGGDGISELPACSSEEDECELVQVVRLVSGKYMAIGYKVVEGDARLFVVRYTSGGLLDTTFSGDGQATIDNPVAAVSFETPLDAALDPQGRVVVLEHVVSGLSTVADYLVRLDFSGGVDAGFGNAGWLKVELKDPPASVQQANGLFVQGDGKLIVSGAHKINDLDWDCDALRLMPDATGLDPQFGNAGRRSIAFDLGTDGNQTDVCFESSAADGRPVLAGVVHAGTDRAFAAVRLTNSYIFVDGFATGTTFFWSSRTP